MEDDRIKVLKRMIMANHDFSDHTWEYEETIVFSFGLDDKEVGSDQAGGSDDGEAGSYETGGSDDDFRTPKGSANIGSRATKGKKRLPDRGMEKRKQKVLHTRAQQAPFDEDMTEFVANLFQQNFAAMEQRLEKQMGERFEEIKSELKVLRRDSSVEVEPSTSKPPPSNPSPNKPASSNPQPSKPASSNPPRRSNRLVKNH